MKELLAWVDDCQSILIRDAKVREADERLPNGDWYDTLGEEMYLLVQELESFRGKHSDYIDLKITQIQASPNGWPSLDDLVALKLLVKEWNHESDPAPYLKGQARMLFMFLRDHPGDVSFDTLGRVSDLWRVDRPTESTVNSALVRLRYELNEHDARLDLEVSVGKTMARLIPLD